MLWNIKKTSFWTIFDNFCFWGDKKIHMWWDKSDYDHGNFSTLQHHRKVIPSRKNWKRVNAFSFCDTRQQIFIQMKEKYGNFRFRSKTKVELKTELPVDVFQKSILSFFMWKSMKTYLHNIPSNLFSKRTKKKQFNIIENLHNFYAFNEEIWFKRGVEKAKS